MLTHTLKDITLIHTGTAGDNCQVVNVHYNDY